MAKEPKTTAVRKPVGTGRALINDQTVMIRNILE
jgi:hypothetical protein